MRLRETHAVQPVAIPAGQRSGGDDERSLVAALRRGEESAFVALVGLYGAPLALLRAWQAGRAPS